MIRRLLSLARFAIDSAGQAAFGKRRGQKDMIDAQAAILRKRELPIVPPTEGLRRLLEQSEAVDQTGGEESAERGALGVRAHDLSGPQLGVVHVAIIGRNVEIPCDD